MNFLLRSEKRTNFCVVDSVRLDGCLLELVAIKFRRSVLKILKLYGFKIKIFHSTILLGNINSKNDINDSNIEAKIYKFLAFMRPVW